MISFAPFKAEHFYDLDLQPAQRELVQTITPHTLVELERKWSCTLLDNGHPILCGGVIENWADSGLLWSFVGNGMSARTAFVIHSYVLQFVESLPYVRLEMHVAVGFTQGHRWAKLLGFECEAPCMRKFSHGRDMALYARIK